MDERPSLGCRRCHELTAAGFGRVPRDPSYSSPDGSAIPEGVCCFRSGSVNGFMPAARPAHPCTADDDIMAASWPHCRHSGAFSSAANCKLGTRRQSEQSPLSDFQLNSKKCLVFHILIFARWAVASAAWKDGRFSGRSQFEPALRAMPGGFFGVSHVIGRSPVRSSSMPRPTVTDHGTNL